jgi:hypothetical protein
MENTETLAPKMDFNVWFALRQKRIPAQHLREIIWADFKARGLSKSETMGTFDAALKKYGIKL